MGDMDIIAVGAQVDEFYKQISGISFTLLGLWFVIVQLKYKDGAGDPRRRRHAYGVALFFLIPGVMAMLSSINSDLGLLWRITFGVTGALGLLEVLLYFTTDGIRTRGASILRLVSIIVYVPIVLLAILPSIVAASNLGIEPREVEAILLGLLIVIGVHIAFLALTESGDTAGA